MLGALLTVCSGSAQSDSVAQPAKIFKISHAEPLYNDLIRDLGARRGEREFNVGWGMSDRRDFVNYSGFVEYEFAPVNHLGLEIEVPIQLYSSAAPKSKTAAFPENRVEGIKLAAQYTLAVSKKHRTSLALGYIQEFEFNSFANIRNHSRFLTGLSCNPIFVAAKKWGEAFHTLIYTGPVFEQEFAGGNATTDYLLNLNVHYVFVGAGHFIGLETNIAFSEGQTSLVWRPQMKFRLSPGVSLGWVNGIPCDLREQGFSLMARLIWEPQKNK